MPRLLFEKVGAGVWISHLDLMRLFQRAFQRAKLPLKHSQGFNPRPIVSIALPLSVGVGSQCELLDFALDGASVPCAEIVSGLNRTLPAGIRVLQCFDSDRKTRDIAFLEAVLTLEYDIGVPEGCVERIGALFRRDSLPVTKNGKNGPTEQDIIPMLRAFRVEAEDENTVCLTATVCAQNPSLNPMQLHAAIREHLPAFAPDFVLCCRREIYDQNGNVFR